jgi:hypothetical protein
MFKIETDKDAFAKTIKKNGKPQKPLKVKGS